MTYLTSLHPSDLGSSITFLGTHSLSFLTRSHLLPQSHPCMISSWTTKASPSQHLPWLLLTCLHMIIGLVSISPSSHKLHKVRDTVRSLLYSYHPAEVLVQPGAEHRSAQRIPEATSAHKSARAYHRSKEFQTCSEKISREKGEKNG